MRRIIFSITFVFLTCYSFSQNGFSFKYVDSLSYALYSQAQWKQLADLGKKASEQKFDYYYLNIRTGVAFAETGDYFNAEIFFRKTLKNNSDDILSKKYLLLIYQNWGDDLAASEIYNSLDDSIKKQFADPRSKVIYVEGGMKLAQDPTIAGNAKYGNIGFGHWIGKKMKMY